jgi:hypothetical protein
VKEFRVECFERSQSEQTSTTPPSEQLRKGIASILSYLDSFAGAPRPRAQAMTTARPHGSSGPSWDSGMSKRHVGRAGTKQALPTSISAVLFKDLCSRPASVDQRSVSNDDLSESNLLETKKRGIKKRARRGRALKDLRLWSSAISAAFRPGFRASYATRRRASADPPAVSSAALRTLWGRWADPRWPL